MHFMRFVLVYLNTTGQMMDGNTCVAVVYAFYEICFCLAEHYRSNDGQKYLSGSVASSE